MFTAVAGRLGKKYLFFMYSNLRSGRKERYPLEAIMMMEGQKSRRGWITAVSRGATGLMQVPSNYRR